MEYLRRHLKTLISRAEEPRRFIQVLAGPRQVGKTTLARRLLTELRFPCRYCSGDEAPGYQSGVLQKYAGNALRKRAAPPKLQVHDNALMTALLPYSFEEAKADRSSWGRITESAVGAHLLRLHHDEQAGLYYWREGSKEVDFISAMGERLCTIEVKSKNEAGFQKGLEFFGKAYPLAIKRVLEENSRPSLEDAMRRGEIRSIY